MIAKTARILVLVIAAQVLLPCAYAMKPGPALVQRAERNQALRRVLTSCLKHHTYLRVRTSAGDRFEGYVTEVNDDSVVLGGGSQPRACVPYGSINKIYGNILDSNLGVLIVVGVLLAVVAASVPKD